MEMAWSASVLAMGLGFAMAVPGRLKVASEARRFRALADASSEGVLLHKQGAILEANAAARRMLLLDRIAGARIAVCVPEGHDDPWEDRGEGESIRLELQRADRSWFSVEVSRRRVPLADGGEGELLRLREVAAAEIAETSLHIETAAPDPDVLPLLRSAS